MKKISQLMEDKLLDYLDGKLDAIEAERIAQLLRQDSVLRERFEALQKADRLMHRLLPEEPSKNFTDSVMKHLGQYPVRSGFSISNGIFLLAGILVVLIIAIMLLSAGVFDETTTVDLNNLGMINHYIRQSLPGIPVDGKWIVNIIVFLNIAVAFIVLDRTILRPLFQRRMQTHQF